MKNKLKKKSIIHYMISTILESNSKNQKNIFYLISITCIILIISIVGVGLHNYNLDIHVFVDSTIDEKKSTLESQVNSRYNEINYDIISSLDKEENRLSSKSITMSTSYNNLDLTNFSDVDKNNLLINSINKISSDEKYVYSLMNTDSTVFFSTKNDLLVLEFNDATLSKIMAQDKNGNYVGIYSSNYLNNDDSKEKNEILTYNVYLENYDCILSVGILYEDFTALNKQQAIEKLDNYYINDNDYIYFMSYDGETLSNFNDKNTIITDNTKEQILLEMENKDNQIIFFDYEDYNSISDNSRISYVKRVPEYNGYLVGIEYLDDVENDIDAISINYAVRNISEIIIILIIFYFGIKNLFEKVMQSVIYEKQRISDEEQLFNKLFEDSHMALMIINLTGTLIHKNNKAYLIFGDIEKFTIINGKISLEDEVDKDTFKVKNIIGEIVFIHIEQKDYIYKNQQVYVCYFNDVTYNYEEISELKEHATIDTLTLIPNRRKLIQDSNRFTKKLVENNCYYILAMIDIDWFKKVNDEFGHVVGDEVLKILANSFNKTFKNKHDHLYRYGGEEFVLYLVYSNSRKAKKVIEDADKMFGRETELLIGRPVHFSAGVIEVSIEDYKTSFEENIRKCDDLLYKAKENGRNRIVIDKEYKI